MASLAIGIAVKYATGSALAGYVASWAVGAYLNKGKGQHTYGPRLQDLRVQVSTEGQPIPKVYGSYRIAGNVIWSSGIKETAHTQSSSGKGGPKNSSTTYTYSCSFAVSLSEGEITGIRRIWADSILIYNKGDTATADELAVSNQVGITVYTGSETQEPDPLMEADKGVGNVPAHRGLAYAVFEDLQLEKYGNRIPNITCEVVESGDVNLSIDELYAYPLDVYASRYTTSSLYMDNNAKMTVFSGTTPLWTAGAVEIRKVSKNSQELLPYSFIRPAGAIFFDGWADSPCCVYSNGTNVYVHDDSGAVVHVASGVFPVNGQSVQYYQRGLNKWLLREQIGYSHVFSIETGTIVVEYYSDPSTPTGQLHTMFPAKSFIYGLTLSKQFVCFDYSFNLLWSLDLTPLGFGGMTSAVGGSDATIREFSGGVVLLKQSNKYWRVSKSGYSFIGTAYSAAYEEHGGLHLLNNIIYYCLVQYNSVAVMQVKEVTVSNSKPVTSIISDLCHKANVTQISTTGITNTIKGYVRTNPMTAKAALDPLLSAYNIAACESDYTLQFRKLDGAVDLLVDPAHLAASTSKTGDPLNTIRSADVELPRRIEVVYSDADGDYQDGNQFAQRIKQ